jgi:hypothetical protein
MLFSLLFQHASKSYALYSARIYYDFFSSFEKNKSSKFHLRSSLKTSALPVQSCLVYHTEKAQLSILPNYSFLRPNFYKAFGLVSQ